VGIGNDKLMLLNYFDSLKAIRVRNEFNRRRKEISVCPNNICQVTLKRLTLRIVCAKQHASPSKRLDPVYFFTQSAQKEQFTLKGEIYFNFKTTALGKRYKISHLFGAPNSDSIVRHVFPVVFLAADAFSMYFIKWKIRPNRSSQYL
jgi:hypothetical protein